MPSVNHPTPPGFIRRRGPKGRVVFEPSEEVYSIHEEFLAGLGKISFPDQCDCVRPHLKNRFFLKLDLRDAYDSVSAFDVEVFLNLSFGDNWIYFFHQDGGFIQGAPASHPLFNLYCDEVLDQHLRGYSRVNCLTYTRYVDDLLFSSQGRIGKKRRRAIRDSIRKSGLVINEKKAVLVDNKYTPITYVGMRIHRGTVRTTREFLAKLANTKEKNPCGCKLKKGLCSCKFDGLMGWGKRVFALNEERG